jgi:hypothetical protein
MNCSNCININDYNGKAWCNINEDLKQLDIERRAVEQNDKN